MKIANPLADPAAVFAGAISLWQACIKAAQKNPEMDLSEAYNGYDELMREMMRIGTLFEEWACDCVRFDGLTEVWPYFLELNFGERGLEVKGAEQLATFRRFRPSPRTPTTPYSTYPSIPRQTSPKMKIDRCSMPNDPQEGAVRTSVTL